MRLLGRRRDGSAAWSRTAGFWGGNASVPLRVPIQDVQGSAARVPERGVDTLNPKLEAPEPKPKAKTATEFLLLQILPEPCLQHLLATAPFSTLKPTALLQPNTVKRQL